MELTANSATPSSPPPLPPAIQLEGELLQLTSVSRTHSGAYLCIASNGVPPSVSKRVLLEVECEWREWSVGGMRNSSEGVCVLYCGDWCHNFRRLRPFLSSTQNTER